MGRRISAAMTLLAVAAALFALLLAAVPAAAHHKDGHEGGGGKAKQEAGEDTADTPDEGDNAHPSGNDKSVESGGSGDQGNSGSDPDDDGRGPDRSNGGPDKPGGSGGVDQDDQDGNNGCGNDDDFEDDNEGWCGRKPPKTKAKPLPSTQDAAPCDADATMAGTQPCKDDDGLDTGVSPTTPCVDDSDMAAGGEELCGSGEDVAGRVISRPATTEVDAPQVVEEARVLGERLAQSQPDEEGAAERAASFLGQTLPFTGSALQSYAAIGVGLLLAGAGFLTARSRT